jgi:hypothetical protein
MWARKSTDNGATWLADDMFSDVVSPLPGQPDPNIVTEYVGDYDYSNHVLNQHVNAWADGRIPINGASQQDPFFDREPASGGGGEIVLQARVRTQGTNHQVQLKWTPADGGQVNVIRNGVVRGTTADDGKASDNLGTQTGSFTYQVCETDSGDCSNEVTVIVP